MSRVVLLAGFPVELSREKLIVCCDGIQLYFFKNYFNLQPGLTYVLTLLTVLRKKYEKNSDFPLFWAGFSLNCT